MAKAQSPLLGFNNNVRHRGRVFHIQTEDSGVKYPHVITHLFADGGRILKSIKTSYAEYLGSETLEDTVRGLMKDQHKAMFIALRDGQFDALLEEGSTNGQPAPPAPARASKPEVPAQEAPKPSDAIEVDVEVLERAAAAAQQGSAIFQDADAMPPPPASVLSPRRPSGSYRALTPSSHDAVPEASAAGGRYSATRPASIFGTSGPSESGSVFGEDMISGKSLDEVILSFLSEEFGAAPDKNGDEGK